MEDSVFEFEGEDGGEEEGGEFGVSFGDGVHRLKEVTEEEITEEKYIITKGRLEVLLDMFPQKRCGQCGEVLVRRFKTIGCTVDCKWVINFLPIIDDHQVVHVRLRKDMHYHVLVYMPLCAGGI